MGNTKAIILAIVFVAVFFLPFVFYPWQADVEIEYQFAKVVNPEADPNNFPLYLTHTIYRPVWEKPFKELYTHPDPATGLLYDEYEISWSEIAVWWFLFGIIVLITYEVKGKKIVKK